MAIALAVIALVLLAGVLLYGAARRRDSADATGTVSVETQRRDVGAIELDDDAPDGRAVERAAALARREPTKDLVLTGSAPPAPFVAPDELAYGVTRRKFLNRSIIGMFVVPEFNFIVIHIFIHTINVINAHSSHHACLIHFHFIYIRSTHNYIYFFVHICTRIFICMFSPYLFSPYRLYFSVIGLQEENICAKTIKYCIRRIVS